jgi:hypothetical protein
MSASQEGSTPWSCWLVRYAEVLATSLSNLFVTLGTALQLTRFPACIFSFGCLVTTNSTCVSWEVQLLGITSSCHSPHETNHEMWIKLGFAG